MEFLDEIERNEHLLPVTSEEEAAQDIVIAAVIVITSRRIKHGTESGSVAYARDIFKVFVRDKVYLGAYCPRTYPEYCVCGTRISEHGSYLRSACFACRGNSGNGFAVLQALLGGQWGCGASPSWLRFAFSSAIHALVTAGKWRHIR